MKKTIIAIATTLLSLSVSAETVLKFSHFVPPPLPISKSILQGWADNVNADSNGSLNVKMYPGMQLGGKPPQLVDHVESGFADIIFTLPGYTPGRFPSFEPMDYPFAGKDEASNAKRLWEMYETNSDIQKDLSQYKVIALSTTAVGDFFYSKPFTVSDIKGTKVRTPTRAMGTMITELGATPVQIPLPDVGLSVSTSVVDGLAIDHAVANPLKFYQLLPYATDVSINEHRLYSSVVMILMNKDVYNNLTDEQKAAIDKNSGLDASISIGEQWTEVANASKARSIADGLTLVETSAEEEKILLEAADRTVKTLNEDLKARGYDADKLYEDYIK